MEACQIAQQEESTALVRLLLHCMRAAAALVDTAWLQCSMNDAVLQVRAKGQSGGHLKDVQMTRSICPGAGP